jgi:4-hydroxy-3-methylbut-2-enyl diphosphate reductase
MNEPQEGFPAVIRSAILGYCFGVRRAVNMAVQAAADYQSRPIYTYGPLIHNPQALEVLKRQGITSLESGLQTLDQDAVVIIRAHGVPPAARAALASRGSHIMDATCPRVVKSQKLAAKFFNQGYRVIVAGDKDHGEVAGIAGFAPGCIIVENPADAEALVRGGDCPQKVALIAQTTINQSEYDALAAALRPGIPELHICDTLCPAVSERQKALKDLCGQVDGVLVIGGRNSANTRRLLSTAENRCPRAALIQSPEEIPLPFFFLKRVGIVAGASTPDETIDAVEKRLKKQEM